MLVIGFGRGRQGGAGLVNPAQAHQSEDLAQDQSERRQNGDGGEGDTQPAKPVGACKEIADERIHGDADCQRSKATEPGQEPAAPMDAAPGLNGPRCGHTVERVCVRLRFRGFLNAWASRALAQRVETNGPGGAVLSDGVVAIAFAHARRSPIRNCRARSRRMWGSESVSPSAVR